MARIEASEFGMAFAAGSRSRQGGSTMNSKSFRDRDFNLGHVVSVRGSVIDAVFPDRLPDMNHERGPARMKK
jgi:hypothetical protein